MYNTSRNELGRLPLKLAVETFIIKFWIHLNSLPENNIAKQCLQLSKEMADKTQAGLMHKINQLCQQYNLQSMTLNNNNEKLFASHIKENISKALIAHQLKLINTNRKLHFYCSFKTNQKIWRSGCNKQSTSQNCLISTRESPIAHRNW